jgi:hypothetical protein
MTQARKVIAGRISRQTAVRRKLFALLRVAQISCAVLATLSLLLPLTAPSSPGHTARGLYFIAWSTPTLFVATATVLACIAIVLTGIGMPLKRRWSRDLRGWIN